MKTHYCWRCKIDIPMMEEIEWEQVSPLLTNMISKIKEYRFTHNCGLREAQLNVLNAACEKYNELTGFNEKNGSALWHHRLVTLEKSVILVGICYVHLKQSFVQTVESRVNLIPNNTLNNRLLHSLDSCFEVAGKKVFGNKKEKRR